MCPPPHRNTGKGTVLEQNPGAPRGTEGVGRAVASCKVRSCAWPSARPQQRVPAHACGCLAHMLNLGTQRQRNL